MKKYSFGDVSEFKTQGLGGAQRSGPLGPGRGRSQGGGRGQGEAARLPPFLPPSSPFSHCLHPGLLAGTGPTSWRKRPSLTSGRPQESPVGWALPEEETGIASPCVTRARAVQGAACHMWPMPSTFSPQATRLSQWGPVSHTLKSCDNAPPTPLPSPHCPQPQTRCVGSGRQQSLPGGRAGSPPSHWALRASCHLEGGS